MTRGPRRLKDDLDFKWETGCDVADEELLVGSYDMPATRSRLLAAVALAAPSAGDLPSDALPTTVGDGMPAIRPGVGRISASSSGWTVALKPFAAAVTGAFMVAGAYWLGVQSGTSDLPSTAPSHETPPAQEMRLQEPVDVSPASVSPSATSPVIEPVGVIDAQGSADSERIASHSQKAPAQGKPAQGKASVIESAPIAPSNEMFAAQQAASLPQGTSSAPEEAPMAPVAPSTLDRENNALGIANEALANGDFQEARDLYQDYLVHFPKGRLRDEAQLGRLQALFGLGDKVATEAAARSVQDLPSLSGRRAEILQLRAESLVLLDRCEEALALTEEIPPRAAAEVRRTCRRSGKESP